MKKQITFNQLKRLVKEGIEARGEAPESYKKLKGLYEKLQDLMNDFRKAQNDKDLDAMIREHFLDDPIQDWAENLEHMWHDMAAVVGEYDLVYDPDLQ